MRWLAIVNPAAGALARRSDGRALLDRLAAELGLEIAERLRRGERRVLLGDHEQA